ncbi:hypothetical protein BC829DRAFT_393172 [Chytridium lagenaria]|nr:hypothetical protein BC829DRAFT_393172 [Chytridium lagenaria]
MSGEKEWTFPLMNSHMDIVNTFIACCVPCVTHGQIHEKAGGSIRRERNIKGNIADDILASYVCGLCSMVQEYHEIIDEVPAQAQMKQ